MQRANVLFDFATPELRLSSADSSEARQALDVRPFGRLTYRGSPE